MLQETEQVKINRMVRGENILHIEPLVQRCWNTEPAAPPILMKKLSDGSAFFVAEIDTNARPPSNPVHWNRGNKVVHNHRTGEIIHPDTDIERAKRGLTIPWTPEIGDIEVRQADIE